MDAGGALILMLVLGTAWLIYITTGVEGFTSLVSFTKPESNVQTANAESADETLRAVETADAVPPRLVQPPQTQSSDSQWKRPAGTTVVSAEYRGMLSEQPVILPTGNENEAAADTEFGSSNPILPELTTDNGSPEFGSADYGTDGETSPFDTSDPDTATDANYGAVGDDFGANEALFGSKADDDESATSLLDESPAQRTEAPLSIHDVPDPAGFDENPFDAVDESADTFQDPSGDDEDFPAIGADLVAGANPHDDSSTSDDMDDEFVLEEGIVLQDDADSDMEESDVPDPGEEDEDFEDDESPLSSGSNLRGIWWDRAQQTKLLNRSQKRTLTLFEALSLAVTMAPDLQVLNADLQIAENVVREQNAAFDWRTFLETTWNQDSNPVGSALDGVQARLRERRWNLQGGVRRLTDQGGEISIGQQFGFRNSNSQFIQPNNQGTGRLSAEYNQPLLRGSGTLVNRAGISLSQITREIAEDDMMAGVENHLLQVATAYWTLVQQRGRLIQSQMALQRAMKLVDFMKNRQEVDVRPNQLVRAEGAALQVESAVVEARHDAMTAQETLLRLIYGSQFSGFGDFEVIPTTVLEEMPAFTDIDFQVQEGLQNRSEIQAAVREIRAATLNYRIAQNEILPQLDLVLSGYAAGLRANGDIGKAFRDQFTEGEPGFAAGLNFEFPYGNRAARAVSDQRQIAIKRFEKQFETVVADVTLDVRSQFLNVERNAQLTMVNEQRLNRTGKELDFLEKRFQLLVDGTRVSDLYLDNLVQSQQRFLNAEYLLLLARSGLAQSEMQLIRGKGMLHTLSMRVQTETPSAIQHQLQHSVEHQPPGTVTAPGTMSTPGIDINSMDNGGSPMGDEPAPAPQQLYDPLPDPELVPDPESGPGTTTPDAGVDPESVPDPQQGDPEDLPDTARLGNPYPPQ